MEEKKNESRVTARVKESQQNICTFVVSWSHAPSQTLVPGMAHKGLDLQMEVGSGIEILCSHETLHTEVQSSFIPKLSKLESTKMPFSR